MLSQDQIAMVIRVALDEYELQKNSGGDEVWGAVDDARMNELVSAVSGIHEGVEPDPVTEEEKIVWAIASALK